ncbi:MAG: GNAT family N-acetyltransferase [Propionibacteriaceae bacterium]|jgi:ribosomal-protein-serine acetyltransferase|nr:GNAT family N-acetyltransferase [Propionibacteriaceae bacterium]
MFYRRLDEHLALKLVSGLDAEESYAVVDRERERLREYLPWVDTTNSVEDQRHHLAAMSGINPDERISCFLTLDGRIIGAVGLPCIDRPARWAEIGYWIAAECEGRGYVTAAVRNLESLCFGELGLERVQITADTTNTRSRAVPERLGYTLEGILRHQILSGHGRIADRAVYALLKPEWQTREALP